MKETKLVRGYYEDLSRKDLVEFTRTLKKKLNGLGVVKTLISIENMIKNQNYIKYTKFLGGVSHHEKRGPCRRPIKVYKYVYDVLKGLKGTFDYISKQNRFRVKRVLVNSTGFQRAGIIRASRGRSAPKKRKHHRILLELELEKASS